MGSRASIKFILIPSTSFNSVNILICFTKKDFCTAQFVDWRIINRDVKLGKNWVKLVNWLTGIVSLKLLVLCYCTNLILSPSKHFLLIFVLSA